MAISSPGIGSNLDVNSIVTQLMALEQKPLTALAKKESGIQAKISALGSLNSALSALNTAASALVPPTGTTAVQKFSVFNASIGDSSIASATASSSAVAGTYNLEVTALAQMHRLVSQQDASYTSSTSALTATGTLRIAIGSKATTGSFIQTRYKDIDMSTSGKTLGDLRDAINAANAGVSATIITTTNDAGVSRAQLVLTSDTAGQGSVMKLSGLSGFNFDPDTPTVDTGTMSQETADGGQAAQNAAFKLNGVSSTSTSNTVSSAIDGITLNLLKQSTSGATTLSVTRDTSSLMAGVNAFVKAYNDFNSTAAGLGSYNTTTKTAGSLNGDSTLRSAQSQMRSLIGNIPAGMTGAAFQHLSDIGVSLQKDGTLTVDSTKLSAAISSNLTGVANLVSAYGSAFKSASDGLIGTSGSIVARTKGLAASIKDIDKQYETVSNRLTLIEARYRKQFTALDTLMSNMTKTSTFLTQQLANLPTLNSKN